MDTNMMDLIKASLDEEGTVNTFQQYRDVGVPKMRATVYAARDAINRAITDMDMNPPTPDPPAGPLDVEALVKEAEHRVDMSNDNTLTESVCRTLVPAINKALAEMEERLERRLRVERLETTEFVETSMETHRKHHP